MLHAGPIHQSASKINLVSVGGSSVREVFIDKLISQIVEDRALDSLCYIPSTLIEDSLYDREALRTELDKVVGESPTFDLKVESEVLENFAHVTSLSYLTALHCGKTLSELGLHDDYIANGVKMISHGGVTIAPDRMTIMKFCDAQLNTLGIQDRSFGTVNNAILTGRLLERANIVCAQDVNTFSSHSHIPKEVVSRGGFDRYLVADAYARSGFQPNEYERVMNVDHVIQCYSSTSLVDMGIRPDQYLQYCSQAQGRSDYEIASHILKVNGIKPEKQADLEYSEELSR
ncbi:hypothetical protein [Neptuniibacter sp. QD37_11]|uniref:hypothetical protein n=1 Tax=Neptuniibacter sp. QD37_11 TaxID=3398209 RepID=UPI0039F4D0D0